MSHMPEGLLHEQAEAVFKETGMGPRELQAKVAEYGAVIEGAVDVNLELQVQRHELVQAAKGLLSHACIADAAPEDVDEEDRALERAARRAVARAEAESQVRGMYDDIWVTSALEFFVGGLRFSPGTHALKRLKQEAQDHGF